MSQVLGGGIGAAHCLMEILSSERRVSFSFELFNNVSEIPRVHGGSTLCTLSAMISGMC